MLPLVDEEHSLCPADLQVRPISLSIVLVPRRVSLSREQSKAVESTYQSCLDIVNALPAEDRKDFVQDVLVEKIGSIWKQAQPDRAWLREYFENEEERAPQQLANFDFESFENGVAALTKGQFRAFRRLLVGYSLEEEDDALAVVPQQQQVPAPPAQPLAVVPHPTPPP